MSFDLKILVEGRKRLKPSVIENIRIEVNSQSGGRNRYESTFTYMTERCGSWCSLFETALSERCFSAYNRPVLKILKKEMKSDRIVTVMKDGQSKKGKKVKRKRLPEIFWSK